MNPPKSSYFFKELPLFLVSIMTALIYTHNISCIKIPFVQNLHCMEPQDTEVKRKIGKQQIIIILTSIVLLTAAFYLGSIYAKKSIPPKIVTQVVQQACEDKTPKEPKGEFLTYTSENLGITFNYYEYGRGDFSKAKQKISEVDNKIYLYASLDENTQDDPTKGMYIEVFQKNPELSLQEAVFQNLLMGDPSKNTSCDFETSTDLFHPNYEYLNIVIPEDLRPEGGYNEFMAAAENCSLKYTNWNGKRYFLMDKGHPDKYIFIYIGQSNAAFPYSPLPGEVYTWNDTIGFIK